MKIKWNSEQIPNLNIKKNEGVTFLTYPAFEDVEWLVHGFSTRLGGVSQGIYSSMNLSFTRGDEESCVRENYNRIAAAMGFRAENIVTSDQTHTCNVRKVTKRSWKRNCNSAGLYRYRWDDYQCSQSGSGNFLCGLRTVIFCRSATPCDWTVSFRMERHCSENRRSYDKKDGRRVRQ